MTSPYSGEAVVYNLRSHTRARLKKKIQRIYGWMSIRSYGPVNCGTVSFLTSLIYHYFVDGESASGCKRKKCLKYSGSNNACTTHKTFLRDKINGVCICACVLYI